MEGKEHLEDKIFTLMMNCKSDFVNKDMNLSTKPVNEFVDTRQRRQKIGSGVNKVVNKTTVLLLTRKRLCVSDFFDMSMLSTKFLSKMYKYRYNTYYKPHTRAHVECPI